MDTATDTEQQPTRQALAIPGRSGRMKVTGKLKVAVDAMVWEGKERKEAAAVAGLTDHSLRAALLKPHVRQYYSGQIDVLRTSQRAKNIHRLCEIRDAANNMPAVQAIKVLEQIEETQGPQRSTAPAPGVVIVIEQAATAKVIDGSGRALPAVGRSDD